MPTYDFVPWDPEGHSFTATFDDDGQILSLEGPGAEGMIDAVNESPEFFPFPWWRTGFGTSYEIILTEDGEQDDVCHVAEPVRRVRPVRRASPVWSVRTHVANAARVAELERQVAELVATVEELRQQTDNEGDDGER